MVPDAAGAVVVTDGAGAAGAAVAGAVIVAEGDPGELDPKDVSEKLPKVFLVSLEPAIEKSLERFDSLFEREGVEVMFDDAEVTSKLDGWDLNRWARHLAGKLLGSETLPPVPEGAPAIGEVHDAELAPDLHEPVPRGRRHLLRRLRRAELPRLDEHRRGDHGHGRHALPCDDRGLPDGHRVRAGVPPAVRHASVAPSGSGSGHPPEPERRFFSVQ